MATTRKIVKVIKSKPTLEGAGVHLKRAFGFTETNSSIRSCCWTISVAICPRCTKRVPLASASRHRDDHLRAARQGGSWR